LGSSSSADPSVVLHEANSTKTKGSVFLHIQEFLWRLTADAAVYQKYPSNAPHQFQGIPKAHFR